MAEPAPPSSPGRDETPFERADRNLSELLGELRVALPGVQVLFAFLLIVPFNSRFDDVSAFQRDLYFAILLCTGLASALLIAPTMYHRIEFRIGDKEHLVKVSSRLAIAGLTLVALAMTGVVALVTDFVFGTAQTVAATALIASAFGVLWYAMPLRRRTVAQRSGNSRPPAEPR